MRERGEKSVRAVAQELHMSEGTLRKWIGKSNQKDSLPTPAATLPVDLAAASWSPAQRLLALNMTHSRKGEHCTDFEHHKPVHWCVLGCFL